MLLPKDWESIPDSRLIICEGFGDANFLCALLRHRGISGCSVSCPTQKSGQGIDGIAPYLKAVRAAIQKGKASIASLLVIVDADDSPTDRFKLGQNALEDAGFHIPANPYRLEGQPTKTGVFIVPGPARTGTLEDLLWDAAVNKNPSLAGCVEAFDRCTGGYINAAAANVRAKMRMSVLVGAFCYGNPWATITLVWSQDNNPIPLESPIFNELGDFLASFAS